MFLLLHAINQDLQCGGAQHIIPTTDRSSAIKGYIRKYAQGVIGISQLAISVLR